METLAFIHSTAAYEERNLATELQLLAEFNLSSSAEATMVGLAAAVSIMASGSSAMAAIGRGDVGNDVSAVQTALLAKGHNPGPVDGAFGNDTEFAIKQFQRRVRLAADGIVGPATAKALGLDTSGVGDSTVPISNGSTVTVTTRSLPLNVRSGPGFEYIVIDSLATGTTVGATGRVSGEWVELAGGGWVASYYVSGSIVDGGISSPLSVPNINGFVNTNGHVLNVRTGPGLEYRAINTLSDGTPLNIIHSDGGWHQLDNGGWVAADWVN